MAGRVARAFSQNCDELLEAFKLAKAQLDAKPVPEGPVFGLPTILAIDPGTTQSGWVLFDGFRVLESGTSHNGTVLRMIASNEAHTLAIERFEARGMPIGEDSIQTVLWTGRFVQAWHTPEAVRLVTRREVKAHLCGTAKAKDPNVRQALIDRIGPPGRKADPGPTYGVASHAWAALGVAVTAIEAPQ